MPDDIDTGAINRAEQVFSMQEQLIEAQKTFLEEQNNQTEVVQKLLIEAQTGNERVRKLAVSELERAVAGRPSPALDAVFRDIEERGSGLIQRSFGPGGETGTGALAVRKNIGLTKAEAADLARRGDINTALGLFTGASGVEGRGIDRFTALSDKPLRGSQVLGQSVSQLGKLSQFNVPQDDFLRNLGSAGVAGLFSKDAFSNLAGNVGEITDFFKKVFT